MLAVEWPLVRASLGVVACADEIESDIDKDVYAKLAALKQRVPAARLAVGARRWAAFVDTPPPRPLSVDTPLASRAFYKLREIQASCALPAPRVSVHLCEAPGGFVQATALLARDDWTWTAMSLPASGGHPAPASHLLPLSRGRFITADVAEHAAHLEAASADLVTADGAVSMDHDRLEEMHFPLLVAQTEAAVHCIAAGGTFIIKFFEATHPDTRRWLAWVSARFDQVSIIKPCMSRPTNSERYLVARGYAAPPLGEDVELRACAAAAAWNADTKRVLVQLAREQAAALERVLARVL